MQRRIHRDTDISIRKYTRKTAHLSAQQEKGGLSPPVLLSRTAEQNWEAERPVEQATNLALLAGYLNSAMRLGRGGEVGHLTPRDPTRTQTREYRHRAAEKQKPI